MCDGLFSKELTAHKIGITVSQLTFYRKQGFIKATKHKNTYRYRLKDIKEFVKKNEVNKCESY